MTVEFDAATGNTTSTASFTHTPTGTPRGVVVSVVSRGETAVPVTGITYGGVSLAQVSSGIGEITGYAGDNGQACIWFLGASVPTGAQTVAVTFSGSANPFIVRCVTLTAAANIEEVDSESADTVIGNHTGTLTLSSRSSWAQQAHISGLATFAVQPLTGWGGATTFLDFGTGVAQIADLNTVTSSDLSFGTTGNGTDELGIVAAAFSEVVGGGATSFAFQRAFPRSIFNF